MLFSLPKTPETNIVTESKEELILKLIAWARFYDRSVENLTFRELLVAFEESFYAHD
jgi:hypothetical protein